MSSVYPAPACQDTQNQYQCSKSSHIAMFNVSDSCRSSDPPAAVTPEPMRRRDSSTSTRCQSCNVMHATHDHILNLCVFLHSAAIVEMLMDSSGPSKHSHSTQMFGSAITYTYFEAHHHRKKMLVAE